MTIDEKIKKFGVGTRNVAIGGLFTLSLLIVSPMDDEVYFLYRKHIKPAVESLYNYFSSDKASDTYSNKIPNETIDK